MVINDLKHILSHSMAFIKDGYTELWVIVNKIYEKNPQMSFKELTKATKTGIKELVENYNVLLLDEETQKPISFTSDGILDKVEKRLKFLNRIPDIGGGIWFTL